MASASFTPHADAKPHVLLEDERQLSSGAPADRHGKLHKAANAFDRILIDAAELASRRQALDRDGGYHYPLHQTPWQDIQRNIVGQLAEA